MGRWLNPDPAGTVDGLNLFRYVRNNPVRLVDVDGFQTCSPGQFKGFISEEGQYYEVYETDENTCLLEPMILDIGSDASILARPGEGYLIEPGSLLLIPTENPVDPGDLRKALEYMDSPIGFLEYPAKGLFPVLHPLKTFEHVGPKGSIPENLREEHDLLEQYPALLREIALFYQATNTTPIIEVRSAVYSSESYQERTYRNFMERKSSSMPGDDDVTVIENMFGDERQSIGFADYYRGNFSIIGEEVSVPDRNQTPLKQYKLTVTDSLGLQGNEPAPIRWLHTLGIIGSKDVVLAEIYVGINADGSIVLRPWLAMAPVQRSGKGFGMGKGTMAPARHP
jgi:hypothetical protein